jgi:hypothetical protein
MNKFALVMILATSCIVGCTSSPTKTGDNKQDTVFFPVTGYIAGQLKLIDSLQLPLVRYATINGRTDTTALTMAECRQLANAFLETDIADPRWKDKYIENSFADQSIPSISFTYETRDKMLPVKRVDIVLKPDPVLADKVKTIYMEKLYQTGDTLVNEKLFWKADHYFQLITSKQLTDKAPILSQVKAVWDPTD